MLLLIKDEGGVGGQKQSLMIADSNHACFVKMASCGIQEVAFAFQGKFHPPIRFITAITKNESQSSLRVDDLQSEKSHLKLLGSLKMSETPPSGSQTPLSLRTIIPAQVQPAKVYAKPTKDKINDVQCAHIYHNSKPAKVYIV